MLLTPATSSEIAFSHHRWRYRPVPPPDLCKKGGDPFDVAHAAAVEKLAIEQPTWMPRRLTFWLASVFCSAQTLQPAVPCRRKPLVAWRMARPSFDEPRPVNRRSLLGDVAAGQDAYANGDCSNEFFSDCLDRGRVGRSLQRSRLLRRQRR